MSLNAGRKTRPHIRIRALPRAIRSGIDRAVKLTVALALAFAPATSALALDVQLKSDVNIRVPDGNVAQKSGLLKKGSIVTIPNNYIVLDRSGKANLELTLNNWLAKAGGQGDSKPGAFWYNGKQSEYFFPVTVKSPAAGSDLGRYEQHYVALGVLARSGSALVVTEDTAAYGHEPGSSGGGSATGSSGSDSGASSGTGADNDAKDAAEAAGRAATLPFESLGTPGEPMEGQSCTGGCATRNDSFDSLKNHLARTLHAYDVESIRHNIDRQKNVYKINQRFKNNCGFPIKDMIAEMKKEGDAAGVPPELLASIMTQETGGECYPKTDRFERDGTRSLGLYQINTGNSFGIPACSAKQISTMKRMSLEQIKASGPRCLENPSINLKLAIRLLKEKYNTVFKSRITIKGVTYAGFDYRKLSSRDAWRLAVSAYNGGERWVLEAKRDLEAFNRRMGANLDAHNWEDLRVFYMRRHLSDNTQRHFFGEARPGRRKELTMINLPYTENVIGRNPAYRVKNQWSLTEIWTEAFKEQ